MLRLQLDRCHSAATQRSISLTWSDRSARLPASPWENLANRREPEPLRAGCAVVVPVQPRVVHEDLEAAADKPGKPDGSVTVSGMTMGLNATLLRFDRAAGRLPGVEPAPKGIHLLKALFAENVRHTGAVLLVGSGSVNDRQLVLRPGRVNVPFGGPDANRSPDLDRTRFPGFVIPYVQHRHQRAGLLPGPDFLYADPQRVPNGVVWGTHVTAPSCRAISGTSLMI